VVVGLEMGAEDYVRKPFMTRELVARVNEVFRGHGKSQLPAEVDCGPFHIDFGAYRVLMDGQSLALSPKEFELFAYLVRNEGRVLTRTSIYEAVWGVDLKGQSRTVDSHVDTLRKKLGIHREMIQGLKGIGYRFEVEE